MNEMKCDICSESDLNEVLILRKYKFGMKATKKESQARRICWGCATKLFKSHKYNFGAYWKKLFFQQSAFRDNRYKEFVEVIH